MIDAVVFDVGETLVDETRAWTELAHAAGLTPLTLAGVLGVIVERGEHHGRVWELLQVPRPDVETTIEADDLYPDALGCLRELHDAGLRLGLAGNQPAAAQRTLAQLGLPVDFIGGSGSWHVHKPDPEFFRRVVAAAGVAPARIAYVGDRLDNDALPALAAGMAAVLIRRGPWGYLHAHRPEAAQASAVIDSLAELPAVLATL